MKTWTELRKSPEPQDRVLVAVIIRLSTTASYSSVTQEEMYNDFIRQVLGGQNGQGNNNQGA